MNRVADQTWRGPRRPRSHRAFGLLVSIGTIVGGLSLVLAGTELMAELGQRTPGSSPPAGRTVASYAGKPTEHPRKIKIPDGGLYGIAWSFRCAPGRSGHFVVEDRSASGSSNPEVTASGQHRHGIWWDHARAERSLYIASDCAWHARIVEPARAGTANPPPGHTGAHKHQANKKKHASKKHPDKKHPGKDHPPKKKHKKRSHQSQAKAKHTGEATQRAPNGHAFSA